MRITLKALVFLNILIGTLAYLALSFIDLNAMYPAKRIITAVESKNVTPAYTTLVYTGKVMVPVHRTALYELRFKLEGGDVSHKVTREVYESTKTGDKLEVHYAYKVFSGQRLVTQVRRVN